MPEVARARAWPEIPFLLSLFLLGLALRVVFFLQFRQTPYFDEPMVDAVAYDQKGWLIAQGSWLGERIFYQDPFYPYFLGALYALFGHSFLPVYLVQNLLGLLLCPMTAALAGRLFSHSPHRQKIAWGSGVLCALSTPFIFYDWVLLKTSLEVFFTVAHLLALTALADGQRSTRARLLLGALGTGCLLGLNLLNRGNYILLAPLFAAWLAWRFLARAPERAERSPARRRAAAVVGCYTAGALLLVLPVTLRNHAVGGEWVLITSQGGQNFYIGNNPESPGFYRPPPGVRPIPAFEESDFHALAEKDAGRQLSANETSTHFFRKGLDWIGEHPRQALALLAKKWGLWWMGLDVADNYDFHLMGSEHCALLRIPVSNPHTFGLLGWSGLWLALLWPRRRAGFLSVHANPNLVLGALFVLGYSLSITLFFVMDRYRVPIFPLLIAFSSGQIAWLCSEWRSLTRAARVASLVPLIVMGFFVFRPYIQPSWAFWRVRDKAYEFVKLADAYLKHDDPDRALTYLRKASLETERLNPTVLTEMGNLYWDHFQLAREAGDAFESLTRVEPDSFLAWSRLGLLRAQEQRWAEAARAFSRAKELDPSQTALDLNLCAIYLTLGQIGDARRAVRSYLLNPPPGDPVAQRQGYWGAIRLLLESPDPDDFAAGIAALIRTALQGHALDPAWRKEVEAIALAPERQAELHSALGRFKRTLRGG